MPVRHLHRATGTGPRGERGETLIEIIITVILIGTGIVALLGSMFSLVVLVNRHRGDVTIATRATEIVERIQAENYVACATAGTTAYNRWLSIVTPTAEIVNVRYLVDKSSATPTFSGSCGTDQGIQQITIRVFRGSGGDRRVTDLTVYKRNDTCPGSYTTVVGQKC